MLRAGRFVALILVLPACKRSDPAVAAASVAGADQNQAVVTAKAGKVQVVRAADGTIAEAKVGDRLSERDALRTEAGEADLAVDGVRVRLHEGSRLELKLVGKQNLRARVRGSVESEVAQKGKLDVEIENSDAIAHSEGGHFFVTADGRGVVAVASVTGTVNVSGGGKSIEVNKGQVTRLTKTDPHPIVPVEALRRVLLNVQWPNQRETNKATLPIAGRVEPGSRVFVQGEPVAVGEGGMFRTEVPLRQGKQKIAVVTVDALGRRKQVQSIVLRDDSLPDVKVKKRLWQWR
jgi:mannose-6-phosphate isomerase-like protein (cupin superfamily)